MLLSRKQESSLAIDDNGKLDYAVKATVLHDVIRGYFW